MTPTVPPSLSQLNERVLEALRAMDREALPVEDDYPTGLWWYAGHLDRLGRTRKVQNSEVCWTQRLAKLLQVQGFEASDQTRYPRGSRQQCDVVVDVGLAKPLWIEVKGAWRSKFDNGVPNASYRKHLRCAAGDVTKLSTLSAADASALMFVLVGFDQVDEPILDEHLMCIRERAPNPLWKESFVEWSFAGQLCYRTRCWAWSRFI